MDIHQLRVFASVFKNKSFSKASEELYLTQPTVSDHVKSLEEELNCKLFDRLGRSIIPTKEAEVLYSHAMEIIEKVNNIKDIIGQFKKEITGELVIGASTIPGTYLMPSIIAKFRKMYPSISFQILISDSRGIVEKISRHELLLGIVGARLANSQITYMPFLEDELIVVSSPVLTKNRQLTLKEMMKLPIVLREDGSGTRRETEKILEDKGVSLEDIKVAGIFGSTDAIKQAVKTGLGVSILSRLSVKDELKYGIFREIKLSDIQMKRKFYIVTHKKRTLPAAYNLFLEHLKA
ncbi:MAG: selenium metabolism-associated LysR family transcriptional regulator [Thermodesulfovibrionales bacterium]|jgi:DNA-binding transcriptional LysR family regulator|nr:selenium metabolism-associated LysR family transcriptional regulator [Thermodesulfovibrionales bacterium]